MSFLSPLWLIGLAPWLALVLWTLRGRGQLQGVPFLRLWKGLIAVSRTSSARRLPPPATIAALLAVLLGIFAASRPAIGKRQQVTVNLIVDRGIVMSSLSPTPRFVQRTDAVLAALQRRWPSSRVNLFPVPGEPQMDLNLDACRNVVKRMSGTALDTTSLLDRALAPAKPNSIVVGSEAGDSINDVAIAALALATQPHAQLMIGLQNFSTRTSAKVQIKSAQVTIEKQLSLPPRGSTSNAFIDLDQVGDDIGVSLELDDDNPIDNNAYLFREIRQLSPDPQTQLSPAQQRIVEVYQQKRVTLNAGGKLPIVDDVEALGHSDVGVVVPKSSTSIESTSIQIAAQPITDHVDWKSLPKMIDVADAPQGWTPVLSFGSHVCVATNPLHPRQVWIGLDSADWARTEDFVIFWTNILDYAGGGSSTWQAHPLTEWTSSWQSAAPEQGILPGIYHRSDGAKRAFNGSALPEHPNFQPGWQSQFDKLRPDSSAGEIAPVLLLIALGLLVVFAATY